jgi:hypothetical protein
MTKKTYKPDIDGWRSGFYALRILPALQVVMLLSGGYFS